MFHDFSPPAIVFLDAWHTLFTVRLHGPQRVAAALQSVGVAVDDATLRAALERTRQGIKALNLPFVATPDHERDWYRVYNGLLLQALGVEDRGDLADRVAEAAHYVPHCILYDDTRPALDALRAAGHRLGVLSNAYPSLVDALRGLGVLDYFDLLVVSAFEGCEKPDPAIYQAALRAARVAPAEALFVDDVPENIEAANALGMVGVLIDRDGQHAATALRRITRLTDLVPLLEPSRPT